MSGFFISKFVTDSFPPLMACHGFFMKVYRFFMKALSISECYCNSKEQSICSCHCRADCMVTLMELQRLDQQSFQPNICLGQNKCLRFSALEKRGMVSRHYYYFFIIKIVYIAIALFTTPSPPPPFFSIFDTILFKIHNKTFRVGTKTNV